MEHRGSGFSKRPFDLSIVRPEVAMRMWFLVILLLSVIVAMARQAPAQQPIVRTRGIEIVDSQGHTRISVRVDATDIATLGFMDAQGRERMTLAVLPDGSSELALRDPQQRIRLALGALPQGASSLVIRDATAQTLFRAP